ncbi:MAG: extracellular solute-binding protein [Chloroflexi bacterium]|nr:extracellular solute-binding protein [Chloroflexota bacterium]
MNPGTSLKRSAAPRWTRCTGWTRRRYLTKGASTVGIGLLGAACAPLGSTGEPAPPGPPSGRTPATIRFAVPFGAWLPTVVEPEIQRFQERFPHITVQVELAGDDPSQDETEWLRKRKIEAASGESVDLSVIRTRSLVELAALGLLADLGPRIKRDSGSMQVQDIWPNILDSGRYKGNQVGLFYLGVHLQVLFYNVGLFRNGGLPTPGELYAKGQWTWERHRDLSRSLTSTRDPERKVIGTSTAALSNPDWRSGPLWTFGADLFNRDRTRLTLDTPSAVECVSYFHTLACQDQSAVVALRDGGVGGYAQKGTLGMQPLWTGGARTWRMYGYEFDIVPLPSHRRKAGVFSAEKVSVLKYAKHPDAAWEYLKFAVTPAQQAEKQRAIPQLPVYRHQFEPWMREQQTQGHPASLHVLKDVFESAQTVQVIEQQDALNEIWAKHMGPLLNRCEGPAPKDVCEAIAREANVLLARR